MEVQFSAEFIILQQVQFLELDDHYPLLHRELVDILDKYVTSDSDSDATLPSSNFSTIGTPLFSSSPPNNNNNNAQNLDHPFADYHHDDQDHDGGGGGGGGDDDDGGGGDYDDDDDDGDDDEEDDDDDDINVAQLEEYVNDELVPRELSNKFREQRMRKLRKRAYSKMKNIVNCRKKYKTAPIKPESIRRKRGLGPKHSYMSFFLEPINLSWKQLINCYYEQV